MAYLITALAGQEELSVTRRAQGKSVVMSLSCGKVDTERAGALVGGVVGLVSEACVQRRFLVRN